MSLPPLFSSNTTRDRSNTSTNNNKAPFFIRRWPLLRHLKINIDRDLILKEAWIEFNPDLKPFMGFEELHRMVWSFLTSIPSVQYLIGKIPDTLIQNTISRHTQVMLCRLVGDETERMEVKLSLNDFLAVFCHMFVIADIERERPHVDSESTLHGLEELDKSLEPYSNLSITGNHADLLENIIIGILKKTPSQRLFQEVGFLIDIVKESFLKYNFSKHQLRSIFMHLKLRQVSAGEYLCQEGDIGAEFYVLFHGLISVRKKNASQHEAEVGEITSGTAFGELSLMSRNGIRHAALAAKRDSVLGILERDDFNTFMYPFVRKVQHDKSHFFQRLPYLSGAGQKAIFDISYEARIRTILPRTLIYHQNQHYPNVVLFIKSGHVRVVREMAPSKGTMSNIHTNDKRSTVSSISSGVIPQHRRMQSGSNRLSKPEKLMQMLMHETLPPIMPEIHSAKKTHIIAANRRVSQDTMRNAVSSITSVDETTMRQEFENKVALLQQRKTAVIRRPSSRRITFQPISEISTQRPVFVEVAVLGPWSAIGNLTTETKKKPLFPASFIAVDHVMVFEVSIFDLLRRLDETGKLQLSSNLFRCPIEDDLREMLKTEQKWQKYREQIRNRYPVELISPRTSNPYRRIELYNGRSGPG